MTQQQRPGGGYYVVSGTRDGSNTFGWLPPQDDSVYRSKLGCHSGRPPGPIGCADDLSHPPYSRPLGPIGRIDDQSNHFIHQKTLKDQVAHDLTRLVVHITGITHPGPGVDGTALLTVLGQRQWGDTSTNDIDLSPNLNSTDHIGEIRHYVNTFQLAKRLANTDAAWRKALIPVFEKLNPLLENLADEGAHMSLNGGMHWLNELRREIDAFIPIPSAASAPAHQSPTNVTAPQSHRPAKTIQRITPRSDTPSETTTPSQLHVPVPDSRSVGTAQQSGAANLTPTPETSWLDTVIGGTKELINQFSKQSAAMMAEEMGISYVDKATGEPVDIAEHGQDMFPPANVGQRAGAEAVKDLPQTEAIVGVFMALGTRGRSIYNNSDEFAEDIKKAIQNSSSKTEAFGELAKEQAKRRKDEVTDRRFENRYHGPDDMTRTQDGRLNEWETKATQDGNARPALDMKDRKQGSDAKNLRRSTIMTGNKAAKVGEPSQRQGGPYTKGEIGLWQEVFDDGGEKDHTFVRVNTTTNQTQVYRQDDEGNIVELIDEFKVEGADEAKRIFENEKKLKR